MIDDTVISLPYQDLARVTFSSGEDINFSSINSKLIKLLENDIALFNLKDDIINAAIKPYEVLYKSKHNNPETINENDLIWTQYSTSDDELIYPSIEDHKHINILAPIIPPNIKWEDIPRPTQIPPGLKSINQEIKNEIINNNNPTLTTYNYILNKYILR